MLNLIINSIMGMQQHNFVYWVAKTFQFVVRCYNCSSFFNKEIFSMHSS